jgi:ABC-2 type transport system permease protein
VTAALYALTLRTQARRGRVLMLVALGLVAVVVAAAIRAGSDAYLEDVTRFLAGFGFALFAPVATLAIASAVYGDMVDDQTLVYIWLRPVQRWVLVAGPYAATLTVALPVVLIPMTAAAVVGGDSDLVAGTILASTVAVVAYSGLFLALGLRVRRALIWGLLYILIWEGAVASIGGFAARLAIRSYTETIMADFTGVDLGLAADSLAVAVIVPLVAAAVFAAYTTRRLGRMDVD